MTVTVPAPSGGDDTAAIKAAIAQAGPDGVVVFPFGQR